MENQNVWYYRNGDSQVGPVSQQELGLMIGQGRLSLDSYVWKQGTPEWIKAREATELFKNGSTPPPFISTQASNARKETAAGVKVAAVLMLVAAIIWCFITLAQIFVASTDNSGTYAISAGWNLIWTVVGFAISIGLFRHRRWAYNWGLTTAVIGVIWYLIEAFSGNMFMLFFGCIELAVAILLFVNRHFFSEHEYLDA